MLLICWKGLNANLLQVSKNTEQHFDTSYIQSGQYHFHFGVFGKPAQVCPLIENVGGIPQWITFELDRGSPQHCPPLKTKARLDNVANNMV